MQVQFSQQLGSVTLFRLQPYGGDVTTVSTVISDLQPRKVILFPQPNGSDMALGLAVFSKKGVYLMDNQNVIVRDKSPKTLELLNMLMNCRADVQFTDRPLPGLEGLTLIESFGYICQTPAKKLSLSLPYFKEVFKLDSLKLKTKKQSPLAAVV